MIFSGISSLREAAAFPLRTKAFTLSALPERLRRRMSGGVYRPEIDGLRFIAIALVIVGHQGERVVRFFPRAAQAAEEAPFLFSLLQRPGLGVLLFFSVSGFILATQAAKANASPLSAGFLSAYFKRRILRIEPPYVLLLVATWALLSLTGFMPEGAHQFGKGPQSLTLSLLASVVYLHDLLWGAFPKLFGPGWSLEVEVQFYLLAPLLFFAYFGLPRGGAQLACGAGLLALGAVVAPLAPERLGPFSIDYSIARYFHFFFFGILLADLRERIAAAGAKIPPTAVTLLGLSGLACLALLPSAPKHPESLAAFLQSVVLQSAPLAAIGAMFVAALSPQSAFRGFCSAPWVSLMGGACYSIYLTHVQLLHVMTAYAGRRWPDSGFAAILSLSAIEIALTLVVGLIFYTLIERTFMIPDWPRLVCQRAKSVRFPAMAWR